MNLLTHRMMNDHFNSSQQQQQPSNIAVEEGIDCRDTNSRFFNLVNRETKLHVVISQSGTIIGCKLDNHEIVLDGERQLQQTHETWAIGDRPYQKIAALAWNCHVKGPELLLSTSNGTSSIFYELTRTNKLNNIVKLKSIHLQHPVIYFNLNNAEKKVPINGHTLNVQCNGSTHRIRYQNTKLLCKCNKSASILPQSLIGDIPFELVRHEANISQPSNSDEDHDKYNQPANADTVDCNEDDVIICDSIFSLETVSQSDYLCVKLQYNERVLYLEIRPSVQQQQNSTQASNNSNNVSSSTAQKQPSKQNNFVQLKQQLQQQHPSHQRQQASSSSAADEHGQVDCELDESSIFQNGLLSSLVDHPVQSPSSSGVSSQSNPFTQPVSQPGFILRCRVRVGNYGVCIMPIMMTNYNCTYRFSW